ncbi:2,3,4,5-tetrahydropyridine-2,6-dicarboxylate N-acetyltransferase [Enterococcus faecalis]|uniref:2,3,4,5-tetrahydropyridine-2,6-dicarboxylate N-acetyltransferase n=1 Tax=Enterococcus faecalis TaxID=1351 RepID=UPI0001F0AAF8|nr:2,3,4,5-tetrahydropyridine-2,6-dicarboxylate N-acetyltransferase [Enterococcus faecalis]EFU15001.1 2,3,4,5-tetrahydropyridine-2,6-dicarboxylate N-acetyltransferase [Enterococcus faecalis TX1342]NAA53777.1 2,3,4,5-tetrahydropyridine-2,6-dicarboxylate N-acetyltransferase [Enterococcus faecalis]PQD02109.1 2,3,4,5-tetrahydropyridine-2,6-dicarboxylate N-acetyltransferase [Enterococcus faecalis]
MDAYEIIQYIGDAEKQTPVKVTLKGQLKEVTFPETIKVFNNCKTGTLFGDWADVKPFLEANKEKIEDYVVENDARNSAIPFLDLKDINARIEPGALIREKVEIGDQAVIMMGAILNIGAVVGAGTMIDMGAVLGGRATVGKHCHIGAGTVLAGVIEPPSAAPVVIENEVVIGANAVVLEGVRVGEGAVVAAGAVVVEDVPAYTVVAGVPAKVIKQIDDKTKSKTEILEELRKL